MAIGKTNSASGGIQPTGKLAITTTQEVDVTDFATAQVEDSNLAAGNIKLGINILGITGTFTDPSINDLKGIIDNTVTSLVMPSGVTSVAQYKFYQCTSLTSLDLTGCSSLGQYAFYGCTGLTSLEVPGTIATIPTYAFQDCSNITNLKLNSGISGANDFAFAGMSKVANNDFAIPSTLKFIGSNAFLSLGQNVSGFTFEYECGDNTTVSDIAFGYSKISKLKGKFASIGNSAFSSCNSLTEIDIEVSGTIGSSAFRLSGNSVLTKLHLKLSGAIQSNAFDYLRFVNDLSIDPTSNITDLQSTAFRGLGSARTNPSSNILTMDFRNSTFATINTSCFTGESSTKSRYMQMYFPSTVSSIQTSAFRYIDYNDYYFTSATPATLSTSGTSIWKNATNYNIFVPYNSVNAYRTATNWTTVSSYIKGWSEENTFNVGDTLPIYNNEGYGLTWYSDKECTTQVTTVADASVKLYCIAGSTIAAYRIDKIATTNCTITVSDGTNTYNQGDMVPSGTVLTITGTPTTTGYVVYSFKVNGSDFTSGDTYTMNANLSVVAIYWDGVNPPYNPTFADNSWDMIRQAFRTNIANDLWNVGDTKTLTTTDGNTYTLRIADMQEGRYNIKDSNEKTNGVIEFVDCIKIGSTTTFQVDPSTGATGWGNRPIKTNVLDTNFWALLPSDLQSAISEITLNEYAYTIPSPRESNNKLFLPADTEVFSQRTYSAEGLKTGCVKYNQWDYYVAHDTNADRVKHLYGQSSGYHWWLRSPYADAVASWCIVYSGGSANFTHVSDSIGVSPCFAI